MYEHHSIVIDLYMHWGNEHNLTLNVKKKTKANQICSKTRYSDAGINSILLGSKYWYSGTHIDSEMSMLHAFKSVYHKVEQNSDSAYVYQSLGI